MPAKVDPLFCTVVYCHDIPNGVAIGIQYDPMDRSIRLATAYCRTGDQYSRKKARTILNARIDHDRSVIGYLPTGRNASRTIFLLRKWFFLESSERPRFPQRFLRGEEHLKTENWIDAALWRKTHQFWAKPLRKKKIKKAS